VVFHVKKGPQFHVAKVDVTGATAIPAVELLPKLKTKAGEPFVERSTPTSRRSERPITGADTPR
jgi:outer membrane protein assembly factor BamA